MDGTERDQVFILKHNENSVSLDTCSHQEFPKTTSSTNLFIPKGMATLLIPSTLNVTSLISLINQHGSSLIKKPTNKTTTQCKPPPRPPNEFMLYRQDVQSKVRSENKNLQNKLVSKLIGKMWREETYEIKQYYVAKAQEVLKQHQLRYPNYKYRPQSKLLKRNKKKKLSKLPDDHVTSGENGFHVYDLNFNPVSSQSDSQAQTQMKVKVPPSTQKLLSEPKQISLQKQSQQQTTKQSTAPKPIHRTSHLPSSSDSIILPTHHPMMLPCHPPPPIYSDHLATSSSLPPPHIDDTIDHFITHYLNSNPVPTTNIPTELFWDHMVGNPWDLFTYR